MPAARRHAPPLLAALLVVGVFLLLLLLLGRSGAGPEEPGGTTPWEGATRASPGPSPRVDLAPARADEARPAGDLASPVAAVAAASEEVVAPVASEGLVADQETGRRLLRVRGRIVEPSGMPRAGARVELHACERSEREVSREVRPEVGAELVAGVLRWQQQNKVAARVGAARADGGGGFEVAVAPGPLERVDLLFVAAEDDADGAFGLVAPELTPDEAGLLDVGALVLRPATRIEVLARADGLPLQGATVRLLGSTPVGEREFRAVVEAVTDAAGLARLRHQGRDLALEVDHPGRAGVVRAVASHELRGPRLRIEVDLSPATEVRGVVRDARGAPVPGVKVHASGRGGDARLVEAASDAEGRFVLPGLATGVEHELTARDPTYAYVEATLTFVPPAELEVRLDDPGSIRLTVVPPEGVAAIDVTAKDLPRLSAQRADPTAPGGWAPAPVGVPQDGAGDRVLEEQADQVLAVGLAPGRYRLHLAACQVGVSGWSGEVTVRAGEESAATVVLTLGRAVQGRLVDAAGRPLGGVELDLRYDVPAPHLRDELRLHTGADGSFGLPRLVPGVEEVTIERGGFEPRTLRIGPEGQLGDVLLTPQRPGQR